MTLKKKFLAAGVLAVISGLAYAGVTCTTSPDGTYYCYGCSGGGSMECEIEYVSPNKKHS